MSIMRKKHLSLTIIITLVAGAIGEVGFTRHAGAHSPKPLGLFEIVETEIEGVTYEVMVRRDPPATKPSSTAYFY